MNRRSEPSRAARAGCGIALLAGALLLAGCSQSVGYRYHGAYMGSAAQSSAAVMPGPGVLDARSRLAAGWARSGQAHVGWDDSAWPEYARRDAALGALKLAPTERPSLNDQRRLTLPRSEHQFIYFERTRRR